MNRLHPQDFEASRPSLGSRRHGAGDSAASYAGLIVSCSPECSPPEGVERELASGVWLVHHAPGNVIPPYGAGHHVEEELVERAVNDLGVRALVVCGHQPCGIAAHLLTEGAPA